MRLDKRCLCFECNIDAARKLSRYYVKRVSEMWSKKWYANSLLAVASKEISRSPLIYKYRKLNRFL